ncbi:pseudouridine synthase [Paucibacter sp. TC2R-5]|uniref:pseudouridine synthase n=1 Tax=Paucibacter sp. TC2R-5 TaxID=2893555 RepID=UPI0021E3B069|nr:pseudouridine synthase [Paucibacter sp. TC2R-5]MCV2357681.1 pseudouridine synthase [Paucibacter sp. TC2R-5]
MNSNDIDPKAQPEALGAASSEAGEVAAPKRKRSPAKPKAEAVQAVEAATAPTAEPAAAEAAAVSKPRAARKTAAKKADAEVAVEVAVAVPVDLPTAVVAPQVADEEAPKRRAPRKTVSKAAPVEAAVAESVVPEPKPLFTLAPEAAPIITSSSAAESGASEAASEGVEQGEGGERGGRNRNRRRGRKDGAEGFEPRAPRAEAVQAEPAPEVLAAVGERFAQVLAGEFGEADDEVDELPEVQEEEEVESKRVLAAEADAPKLQKVLAQAGIGSRRDIEDMIADGKIEVNGEVAHIGQRISFGDNVRVAGKAIRIRISPPPPRILAYHKPAGEVVTFNDPEGRPTVFRHLPRLQQGKWQAVGRLDMNTEGLLLFTNSGELANQLMHPRFGVEREYAVRVLGTLNNEQRARLLEGVIIEGQKAAFKSIEDGGGEGINRWYRVVITEGRNREVRKLFDSMGLTVSRLIRIRYGTVVLPRGLKRCVWIELGEDDVQVIRRLAGGDQARGGREERGDRGDRGDRGGRGERGERNTPRGGERANEQRAERGPDRGGERGGDRNAERGNANTRGRRADGRHAGVGPRPSRVAEQPERGPGNDRGDRGGRGRDGGGYDRPAERFSERPSERSNERGPDRGDDDFEEAIPRNINPLEQTFDRRFAGKGRGIPSGFGAGGSAPDRGGRQGGGRGDGNRSDGPRQPDPLQTSVGYIGADAFVRRSGRGGGGGRGGQGGNSGGGGRSGGGYGGRNR